MRVSEVHAAESVAYLNRTLARLQDIWDEIGIPEEQRQQRTKVAHTHIKDLLDEMILEEQQHKQNLLNSIESCLKDLQALYAELQLPPFEEEDGLTMLQLERNCRKRLEKMREHKSQRMEELKALVAEDCKLCTTMGTSPFSIDHDRVPSLTQLETFRAHLEDRNKEKVRRHNEFMNVKKEVIACMEELECQMEISFEMEVTWEDEEAYLLSTDNIGALKRILTQLQERKRENERHCSTLRTKIQELWDRLKTPQEEREALGEHMVRSKRKDVEALQVELQRLEQLKLQNIKSMVEAVRVEIALLWKKCFYSPDQQQAFPQYHQDDFTEDLLNRHEDEVTTLKKYFEERKELLEGVTRWQENWTLYLELDKKANDPTRFNNRGGNLLKEEKQRSDLQKSLPKLEKSLKVQIDALEQQQGKEFLVNGQKFLDYVEQQWTQHHSDKEKEKMERQLKRTKQTQEDMLYGTVTRTPSKRRLGGTPTPGKMRKINSTTSISTPNSMLGGTLCQMSMQKPPLSSSKGVGLRTPGHGKTPRALERNKENLSHLTRNTPGGPLRPQEGPDQSFSLNSIAGSYSEFTRDLTKASKSSVKSGHLNSTVSHH